MGNNSHGRFRLVDFNRSVEVRIMAKKLTLPRTPFNIRLAKFYPTLYRVKRK